MGPPLAPVLALLVGETQGAGDAVEGRLVAAALLDGDDGQYVEQVAVGEKRRGHADTFLRPVRGAIHQLVLDGDPLRQPGLTRLCRLAKVRVALRQRANQRVGGLGQVS